MDDIEKFILCKENMPRVRVTVWAEIKDGCLKISGHDLGNAVENFIGESELEYFYNFNATNTELLFKLLSPEDADDFQNIFYETFSGIDGCNNLREFCKENNVEYSFFSC